MAELLFFHNFSLILMKRQQGPRRKGEVGKRYGVEHGVQRYWGSASDGSSKEQRRTGFRFSVVIIMRSKLMAT